MKTEKSKKEIILSITDALGIKSINELSDRLGYSNSSGIYNMLNDNSVKKLGVTFKNKVVQVFPNVNLKYLNNESEIILTEIEPQNETSPAFKDVEEDEEMTSILLIRLLKEQKKTNELLSKILEK